MTIDRIAAARDAGWAYFKRCPDAPLAEAWWAAQREGWGSRPEQDAFVDAVKQARKQRDERGRGE